jgi:hypothetical protein
MYSIIFTGRGRKKILSGQSVSPNCTSQLGENGVSADVSGTTMFTARKLIEGFSEHLRGGNMDGRKPNIRLEEQLY